MIMRRRPLLRAAAVGGTAYMAGRHVATRQAEQQSVDEEQEARLAELEQQRQAAAQQPQAPYVPPQQAPPSAAGPSIADQLSQLIELHKSGALTDDEFAAAKAQVLGQ